MDTTTKRLLIIGLIVVALALVYFLRGRIKEFSLGRSGVKAKTFEKARGGAEIEEVRSRHGGVEARDGFGGGASIKRSQAAGDIRAVSTPPPPEKRPKA